MIVGIGVDSIEIARVERALKRPGLEQRLFTVDELAQAPEGKKRPSRLAAVFAGKEAVLKALGTGLRGHSWQDIQILHQDSGAPKVELLGKAQDTAHSLGITGLHISLSHDQGRAIAFCIAEGE